MRKVLLFAGGILMVFTGILSGCGDSESSETSIVSEEINWPLDDTTVYATITRPETGENMLAIVFVPGSGPTDRDWNSPLLPGTNGSAALLAKELAAQGYITIRYDKRFAGIHATENIQQLIGKISMQSHMDELQGAVDILAARDDVDSSRIFVLANSEGTIHAINYQLQSELNKFAGMILTGAPGRTVGEVAHSQIEAQLAGYSGAKEIMTLYDKAITGFLADGTINPDASLPDGIKTFLYGLANPVNMPFSKELWEADIAPNLKNIRVPVLIIIGKKDIQIDWQVDGGKLEEAATGMDNINFVFPENANHVLKNESKAREEINLTDPNYNGADTMLDADTLETIINWLEVNS